MIHEVIFNDPVNITTREGRMLTGRFTVPRHGKAVIIFSHGSGSGHNSPRNNFVAKELQKVNFATLLVDLLTPEETQVTQNRFDTDTLTNRLLSIIDWISQNDHARTLPIGLFGASTGAAAALYAAAKAPGKIRAIVSRGGRPDMATPVLEHVKIPVLLIVGRNDQEVLELNQKAVDHLSPESELLVIPDAGHLFEEPGKLEEVSIAAKDWFLKYM